MIMKAQKNSAAEADTTNQRNFITRKRNHQGLVRRKIIDFIMFIWLCIAVGGADSLEPLQFIAFIIPPMIWAYSLTKRSKENG